MAPGEFSPWIRSKRQPELVKTLQRRHSREGVPSWTMLRSSR